MEHEIDLELFKTLTENELRELGIPAFGVRRRMLLAIAGKFLQPVAFVRSFSNCVMFTLSPVELNKKTVFSGSAAPGAERRAAVTPKDV